MKNNVYPYYLHDEMFINYWENYFKNNDFSKEDILDIYIDFPFCRNICKFCIYGSLIYQNSQNFINEYKQELLRNLNKVSKVISTKVNNLYFGGGTPSLCDKEYLLNIKKSIIHYDDIDVKTFEVHPYDLNNNFIDFLIDEMKINIISIGIQTFDKKMLNIQKRISIDIDKINKYVNYIQNKNCFVNIDLIALLENDHKFGWEVFNNDLDLCIDKIKPDAICCSPDLLLNNFYGITKYFRKFIYEKFKNNKIYKIDRPNRLSLDENDILNDRYETYYFRTKEFQDFYNTFPKLNMDHKKEILKNNSVIALGGSELHPGISIAGRYLENIKSFFDLEEMKFFHKVYNINNEEVSYKNDRYIGNCKVDTNIDFSYDNMNY